MSRTPLLAIDDLRVQYGTPRGTVDAVRGVSLEVRAGEVTALVGESGSGKSSVAQSVIGLLPENGRIVAGRIRFDERTDGLTELVGLPERRWRHLRGRCIALIPQDPSSSLDPVATIGASVGEALRIHGRRSARDIERRVLELLEQVEIDDPPRRARQYPHELSGGMRQRALIAAALALEPELIIADEATSALDVTVQRTVLDLLDRLRHDYGSGVLFITHDLAVAADRADSIVVMRDGAVQEAGAARSVLSAPGSAYTRRLLADAPSLGGAARGRGRGRGRNVDETAGRSGAAARDVDETAGRGAGAARDVDEAGRSRSIAAARRLVDSASGEPVAGGGLVDIPADAAALADGSGRVIGRTAIAGGVVVDISAAEPGAVGPDVVAGASPDGAERPGALLLGRDVDETAGRGGAAARDVDETGRSRSIAAAGRLVDSASGEPVAGDVLVDIPADAAALADGSGRVIGRTAIAGGVVVDISAAEPGAVGPDGVAGASPDSAGRPGALLIGRDVNQTAGRGGGAARDVDETGRSRSIAAARRLVDSASGERPAAGVTVDFSVDEPAARHLVDVASGERPAAAAPPLVEVIGLRQEFPRGRGRSPHLAVDGVSFTVARGTTHAIVGESGSGKSTTGRSIAGLHRPTAGRIRVGGTELTGRRTPREFRRCTQLVSQNPYAALDPRQRIGSALAEPLVNFGIGTRAERAERVAEQLRRVALDPGIAGRLPRELSGGQRQRVAIARALILEPELVVLDEAVSALDVTVQAEILRLLARLQAELGLTYVFISHDLAVVRAIADTVSVLQRGAQVEHGTAAEVLDDPRHPCTRELLRAVPGAALDRHRQRRATP